MEGWQQRRLGEGKPCLEIGADERSYLTTTGLLMEGHSSQTRTETNRNHLRDPGILPYFQCYGEGEAVTVSKKRIKPNHHTQSPSHTRPGSLQAGRAQRSRLARLARRVYEYAIDQFTAWVLLGASFGLQPDCGLFVTAVLPRLSTNPREYSLPLRFLTSLDRSRVPKIARDLGDPASPVSQIPKRPKGKNPDLSIRAFHLL